MPCGFLYVLPLLISSDDDDDFMITARRSTFQSVFNDLCLFLSVINDYIVLTI